MELHRPGAFEFFLEYEPIRDLCLIAHSPSRTSAHDSHPYDDPAWVDRAESAAHEAYGDFSEDDSPVAKVSGSRVLAQSSPLPGRGPSASERSDPVRFVCTPNLRIRGAPQEGTDANEEALPYAGITLQTQVTRCLGPLRHWAWTLAAPVRSGYTMIHFTPVQKRGASGSAYSIWDQLTLDPELFRGDSDVITAADRAASDTLRQIAALPADAGVRAAVEAAAAEAQMDLEDLGMESSASSLEPLAWLTSSEGGSDQRAAGSGSGSGA